VLLPSNPDKSIDGIVFTTKTGLFWLDSVDHFSTHYGLVLVGTQCIVVGWLFRPMALRRHIDRIFSIRLRAG